MFGDFAFHQLCACLGRRISAAAQDAAARAPAETRAPERRRKGRVVTGVGEQVDRDQVGLDLDLAVETAVASELAEEALLDAGLGQAAPMLEHEMTKLVGEN